MSLQPETRLTEEERANLVAFLDGEAEESLARSLEEKVARSVSVRKEIEALQRTWGLLDWLPRPEVSSDFASQTITRIHSQQIESELTERRVKRVAVVFLQGVAWVACIIAMVTLGFSLVRYAWPDPMRDLINHLDLVENMETYQAIPDLKFLDDLSRLGIFVEPSATTDAGEVPEAKGGTPADAQRSVQNVLGEAGGT